MTVAFPHTTTRSESDAYLQCRDITREYARSFYFASHVLPKPKRMAAYAVYTFCRHADNTVDTSGGATDVAGVRRELDRLRRLLDDVYGETPGLAPLWVPLRETVRRYGIPKHCFLDLLRGVEMDLSTTRYSTFRELSGYCYSVASVVGLAMTHIFGVSDPRGFERAVDLGTAMQLTNILRDVGEDHARGRIYLPAEDLLSFGVNEAMLARGEVTPQFIALMEFQIERARSFYRRADEGMPLLTDDGSRFCVRLMRATYAGILDAIEENGYDVFGRRASVTLISKVKNAAVALASSVQERT